MIILSLDCGTAAGSVSLCEDDKLIAQSFINRANSHSETLLPMAVSVLENSGMSTDDIDMFACATGPGSFTGLRICVSTVKGLAFGKNKPCVGVSTLDALAMGLKDLKGLTVPVLDARRCGLYNAMFLSDGEKLTRLTPDRLILENELAPEIISYAKENKLDIHFTGDAVGRIIKYAKSARVKAVPGYMLMPNAYFTSLAALEKYNNTEDKKIFTDEALSAFYLRATQAERERIEKEGTNK